MITTAALDISTGPAHFSDRRASTFYLSLARTDHLDICRATRFQIVVARTMTNHSMYFSRGRKSHLSVVFPLSFATARRQRDASRSQAYQSNTLTSVFRSRRTRYFNHPGAYAIRERTPSGSVRHPGAYAIRERTPSGSVRHPGAYAIRDASGHFSPRSTCHGFE